MVRILTIYAVSTSFLVVPALCMGGVITHACECPSDIARTCEADCEHGSDGGHESGCGHEGGCPEDPCSIEVLRPEHHGDDIVTPSQPSASITIILVAVTQPSVQTEHAGTQKWPGGKKLAFPPSDLPLLI